MVEAEAPDEWWLFRSGLLWLLLLLLLLLAVLGDPRFCLPLFSDPSLPLAFLELSSYGLKLSFDELEAPPS